MRSAFVAVLIAITIVACSSESTPPDRTNVQSGGTDAGRDGDALAPGEPDPNDGRDEEPASCYAACQNAAFTCQAKGASGTVVTTAELVGDQAGCTGTLTSDKGTASEKTVALKLDCGAKKVCTGDAPGQDATTCVPARFNAFSFGYTPAGGVQNVCTRD